LADSEVTEEEQNNLLKHLEKKETEYMRLQRHKMGADDFEPLTMIGKGAFGEVYNKCFSHQYSKLKFANSFLTCLDRLTSNIFQVRICKEKTTGNVYAMKKLKKSEMLRRGQVAAPF